ncbi:hypothetical protein BJV82DRAFT_397480 [Fennellomyces sp. T-0311]|nr:hypothetical protein BJV82DRAFT_397480 [Fennellomyces sp. T-0311]
MEDNTIYLTHLPFNGFIDSLPFEITVKVFSFLKQRDCLACMAVCRQWYTMVPLYSRDVWKELYISTNGIYEDSKRWEQCVGVHVEQVKFDYFDEEEELYDAMQRLIDCGCHQVRVLEFERCTVSSHDDFLPLLKQLLTVHSTIELAFVKHSSYLAYLHMLNAFPNLSRFVYTQADDTQPVIYANIPPVNLPNVELSNLSHLVISTEIGMASILQKSPNLEYLAYGYANQNSTFPIYPDQLFSWCPKLAHLELNSDYVATYQDPPLRRLHTKNTPGLRCFIAHNTIPDQMGPYLQWNSDTLEYIRLVESQGGNGNWSAIFRNMWFPRLRKLICQNVVYRGAAMDTMLTRCNAIEELVITGDDETIHLPSALWNLPRLRRLKLVGVTLIYNEPTDTGWTSSAAELTKQFKQLADNGSRIEEIRLKSVDRLTEQLLLAIPMFRDVKVLEIDLPRGNPGYTDDVLCQFIELLSQTNVKSLTFSGMRDPSVEIIHGFANLPFLEKLELQGHRFSISIDATLLIHLLHNCRNLKSLIIIALRLTGTDERAITYLEREVYGFKVTNAVNLNSHDVIISLYKEA